MRRMSIAVAIATAISLSNIEPASAHHRCHEQECAVSTARTVPCFSTQAKFIAYARAVYRRDRVSKRAARRLDMLRHCARSQEARSNMLRFQRAQGAERRMRKLAYCGSPTCNRRLVFLMVARRWGTAAGHCMVRLAGRESGFSHRAANPSSGAYGIPQALPGYKMRSHGADWATNPATQIRWMMDYVAGRYGGACAADAFQMSHNWY